MVRHQLWHITRILQHWHMSFFLVLLMRFVYGVVLGVTRKVHVTTNFGEAENLKL